MQWHCQHMAVCSMGDPMVPYTSHSAQGPSQVVQHASAEDWYEAVLAADLDPARAKHFTKQAMSSFGIPPPSGADLGVQHSAKDSRYICSLQLPVPDSVMLRPEAEYGVVLAVQDGSTDRSTSSNHRSRTIVKLKHASNNEPASRWQLSVRAWRHACQRSKADSRALQQQVWTALPAVLLFLLRPTPAGQTPKPWGGLLAVERQLLAAGNADGGNIMCPVPSTTG